MNSANNQMPLDEQSRRLTQFAIGNQEYDFNRFFYAISIGPAAFSAFMSKTFRTLILKKNAIIYLDDDTMKSQTKDEMLAVLEKYHQILQNQKHETSPRQIIFFLNTRKIDSIQKLQPPTNKKKSKRFLEC